MANDLIPEDVRRFIVEKIDSVADLEGLLLLQRNEGSEWNADSLARELYTNREQAGEVLEALHLLGFLTVKKNEPRTFQYQPATANLAELVSRIAEVYSKYLIPVTNLIHSKPETRVQKFADAFDLRKKEDN
jgi:hypothetical protein